MKKTTEILIEIDELVVLNHDDHHVEERCPHCRDTQALVTPLQASRILGVSVRTINRWVESGDIHFVETSNGLLLVCVRSLGFVGDRQ